MIITHASYVYDTGYIDQALLKNVVERDTYERAVLNEFFRSAYSYYARIRDCVNTKKCKKLKIEVIRERLKDNDLLLFTERKTNLNAEQINYILDYSEKYNPIIK
ncbi:MAG: hypothetical protein R3267_12485 [Paenisporosarcina sp.]|nr:hypothetical protein [Paenisporosarcina sp.]